MLFLGFSCQLRNKSHKDIAALKTGNIQVYETIFKQYYAALVVFAVKYVTDTDIAREIVQDFFVRFYEKRDAIKIDVSLKSYLYRSVYNSCINYINQRNIHERHVNNIKQENEFEENPEDAMMSVDIQKEIYDIIETLPPKCKKIFKMNRFEGLKNEEIAQTLNLSKRTVETQISKALKVLRNKLSKYK